MLSLPLAKDEDPNYYFHQTNWTFNYEPDLKLGS